MGWGWLAERERAMGVHTLPKAKPLKKNTEQLAWGPGQTCSEPGLINSQSARRGYCCAAAAAAPAWLSWILGVSAAGP